jgi:hypothetical protein
LFVEQLPYCPELQRPGRAYRAWPWSYAIIAASGYAIPEFD